MSILEEPGNSPRAQRCAAVISSGSGLYALRSDLQCMKNRNVSTTATYYIKTAADDVRSAMVKLEQNIPTSSEARESFRDTEGH